MSELRLHPLADAAGITMFRFIVIATLELAGSRCPGVVSGAGRRQ